MKQTQVAGGNIRALILPGILLSNSICKPYKESTRMVPGWERPLPSENMNDPEFQVKDFGAHRSCVELGQLRIGIPERLNLVHLRLLYACIGQVRDGDVVILRLACCLLHMQYGI